MSALLVGLLAGAFTLGGVGLGGLIAFAVEAKRWQRERADQKRERIRQVYAEWVGALLKETHLVDLFLNMQEQRIVAGEVGMNALNAGQQENIAFAKVMLIDGDKKRTKDAQEVRVPLKDILKADSPAKSPMKALEELNEVTKRQSHKMSRFLDRVCDELDGED